MSRILALTLAELRRQGCAFVTLTQLAASPAPATLVSFADVGADGGAFRVWRRAPEAVVR